MCLLLFFRLRRSFLRVFSISIFLFSPIIYRGVGTIFVTVERLWCHSGCPSRSSQALLASFMPVWLPQEGLERQSFLTRRTLTRHAQACTDRTSRPTPNTTETGPTSRGFLKTQKRAPRAHPESARGHPQGRQGRPREPKRKPRERKRPPGSSKWRPACAQVLQNTHFSHFTA